MRFGRVILLALAAPTIASSSEPLEPSPEKGYELLLSKPYLPSEYDEELFAQLWKVWPEDLRNRAAKATAAERRRMAFERYGFVERPGHDPDDPTGPPLSHVVDEAGGWVSNCFFCHAGKVAGRVIPGAPNTHIAMKTLADDLKWTRLLSGGGITAADVGKMAFPLGGTDGTTNAVGFGVAFGAMRNPDMTVKPYRRLEFEHHDMDAPPWWNVSKKQKLYADGYAPKTHRMLMTFVLDPSTGPEQLDEWEDDFRHIEAYIESLEPPEYPWEIDDSLAATGRVVFEANCSTCHGTYGEGGRYPQKTVPLDVVGTDPVRLRALTPEHRGWQAENWISRFGKDPVERDPIGYVAPPLDGIWASAPYLHNGSIPTLWHLLHPDERPVVWRRTENGYDRERVGLEAKTYEAEPDAIRDAATRREFFDTRLPGKNAAGHDFPAALDADEKRAVLEYLKSL